MISPSTTAASELVGPYEIRPYRPGDEHAILATFERVFGADRRELGPLSLADWRWAYSGNPAGLRVWVALVGGEVVAHYAARPTRTLVDGEVRVFSQIVDSMVHPEHRLGLKNPGLFARTGHAMLSRCCGAHGDAIAYGWPTRAAWRVGQRMLGYELIRRETGLVLEPGRGLPHGALERVRLGDGRMERLYRRIAPEWRASTIRDERYLAWRLSRPPGNLYEILGLPGTAGDLAGAAVIRSSNWPFERTVALCDWLVPSDDVEAAHDLLDAVVGTARDRRARAVLALFPEWSPWFRRFLEWGFGAGASDYYMVSGTYNDPRYDPRWLRDHWWYQPLDLDLF